MGGWSDPQNANIFFPPSLPLLAPSSIWFNVTRSAREGPLSLIYLRMRERERERVPIHQKGE